MKHLTFDEAKRIDADNERMPPWDCDESPSKSFFEKTVESENWQTPLEEQIVESGEESTAKGVRCKKQLIFTPEKEGSSFRGCWNTPEGENPSHSEFHTPLTGKSKSLHENFDHEARVFYRPF